MRQSFFFRNKIYAAVLLLFFCCLKKSLLGQACNNDSSYFSIQYKGITVNNFHNAIITSSDEVVALGEVNQQGNFVTKFTSQGNVLWTNQYKTNYKLVSYSQFPWYTNLVLNKIIMGNDSTYYITGSITEHGSTVMNVEQPPAHQAGVLLKIDKFGNVIWGKNIGTWGTEYSVENIMSLPSGDLLIYLASYANSPVNKIIYLNGKGVIQWVTPLITQWPTVSGSSHAMKQIANGNFVIADEVYRNQNDTIWPTPFTPIPIPAPLYFFNFFGLDKTTGKILWDQNYRCPTDTASIPAPYIPDIKHINQLPDGKLSFFADMYMPVKNTKYYANRATNVITDSAGLLVNTVAYSESGNPTRLVNALDAGANGEQIFLAQDNANGQSLLTKVDKDGQILWSKAFANASAGLPPSYFLQSVSGNRFFLLMSDPSSQNLQMLISDKSGNISCASGTSTLAAENTTWPWKLDLLTFINLNVGIDFGLNALNIIPTPYTLQSNTDCKYQYVCCSDVIDSVNIHQVALCSGTTYTLPDKTSTVVSDSGRYYVTYTTPNGCDSTVFYQVTLSKNPKDLSLVKDTCISGQDSLIFHPTDGFASYTWMNSVTTNEPSYTVYQPGTYWVSVSNICGMKTDTANVYDKCNFPVSMPNAFTPNMDGRNDVFRVPVQNKNHLLSLVVFNRYGERVFSTSDPSQGWDGRYRGKLQAVGTYVYFLRMRGLDGKDLSQKGTVILIR